ncbi:MAG: hypothetical protein FRX49_13244 [Trebouxia sp. A1-2]|nr:MAG: hypothetical protein FRX49_13244 [Trebouxia sp. A1-2]
MAFWDTIEEIHQSKPIELVDKGEQGCYSSLLASGTAAQQMVDDTASEQSAAEERDASPGGSALCTSRSPRANHADTHPHSV